MRKLRTFLSLLLALCMVLAVSAVPALAAGAVVGDANGDGSVNNVDAMLILQHSVGLKQLDEKYIAACDVNGDKNVNNVDAMQVLQYAVGLLTKFPVEEPKDETEPEHQHSYDSKVTAPTCETKGYTTYTCSCGSSYTEIIAKTGHSYKTETVAPTTEAEGYDLHTCSNCGHQYKDNYTDKLPSTECTNHEYEWVCNSDGVSDTIGTCSVCGETKVLSASQSTTSDEALAIINAYREAEGLGTLTPWTKRETGAKLRATELTVYYSHNRPDGSRGVGTCIAAGYGSAQAVVDGWMGSSNHRGSLMDPNATTAIVAYNGSYWVLCIK